MKWKILFRIITLLLIFLYIISFGQNYRINYQMTFKKDSLAEETQKKDMILLINKKISKFYSKDQLINDSLMTASEKNGLKSQKKYDYNFMIIKDNQERKIYKFSSILRNFYKTTEEMPFYNWKVGKETNKIGNYICQKATLNYSNRVWEAWFTTDIALQDGPSVFNGLPGLIVYMKDTTGSYEFQLTAIKKDESVDINYLSAKPLDVTKKQISKVCMDHYNDPYREMKSGNVKVIWQDEKGQPFTPDYKELTKQEQDYIRRNNNPIELSEAIKYP
ncbi:hypothetical protein ACM39_13580 [Chryseobacterium sp. FH2]|uniref:GLPGLI family protein n=1 Tax=Chryseobacterium sp. FH2 TaxID=1674291 RepID=UPI00065D035F|nr:GLPGLI family protein [Chryseobacterium sp. FH2]KMQ67463.1 hypothetical protein ACM39_13580 [Chryseobacterium sp. FH2]